MDEVICAAKTSTRMIHLKTLLLFPAVLTLSVETAFSQTPAADTGVSSVQIATDTGGVFSPRKQNKAFERVGLKPGQLTTITLQFPSTMAAQTISAAALDGGAVTLSNQGRIAADGSISMTYKAGTGVGLYRVLVNQGDTVQIVQFWVRDIANPQNNPPVYPGS